MKKCVKKTICFIASFMISFCMCFCAGCSTGGAVCFEQKEYLVSDGDSVHASGSGVSYRLVTAVDGVSVSDDGVIAVGAGVMSGAQVIVAATVGGEIKDTAVCTVRAALSSPEIEFTNLSDYIVSGDSASAVSTPAYAITYSLKQIYPGVSINSITGRVTYSGSVTDGTQYTVVAAANGYKKEKTFIATVGEHVRADAAEKICEYGAESAVQITLDFGSDTDAEGLGVLAVSCGREAVPAADHSYDKGSRTLTVSGKYISSLPMGKTELKIVTGRNAVTVTLNVATFLATGAELAAINKTQEALAGNYIMVSDIDLTRYLGKGGAGYDNGKGWVPIGTYNDVTDGTALDWAFTGTFDGNGHKVTGFFLDRHDDYAYNSGLFGYITNKAVVKNVGLVAAKPSNVCSYSGGFVGVNAGTVTDCWASVDMNISTTYKVIGGFVGRNEGTIKNCYSLGKVSGGESVGCFLGSAVAENAVGTLEHCYAVATSGKIFTGDYATQSAYEKSKYYAPTCRVYQDVAALKGADFSSYSQAWEISSGELPVLKIAPVQYGLHELVIANTQKYYTRGDIFTLDIESNPPGMLEGKEITYDVVRGTGLSISDDGVVNTFSYDTAQGSVCTIVASCGELSASYSFTVYDKVSRVLIDDDMETVMNAGTNYRVDAMVIPDTADRTLKYELTRTSAGVVLDPSGVLYISPNAPDGEIEVTVTAVNGKKAVHTATVKSNKTFESNYKIVYRGVDDKVEYTLPASVAARVQKVTRFDKAVGYELDTATGKLAIPVSAIDGYGTREISLKIITDTDTFLATAVCYDKKDVIEIGSVEAFMDFHDRFVAEYDSLKDKVVLLTADLDFTDYLAEHSLSSIRAIGNSTYSFNGVFNGNGHKISNVSIACNYSTGPYTTEAGDEVGDETVYPYHTTFFNVGLFSYIRGSVTSVNFENVKVASLFTGTYVTSSGAVREYHNEPMGSYVGVVAGTIAGSVTNCTFTGCTVKCATEYRGIVTGRDGNTTVKNCYIDGKLYEK